MHTVQSGMEPASVTDVRPSLRFTAELGGHPLVKNAEGRVFFKAQPIVRWLLERAKHGTETNLNDVAMAGFNGQDVMEFYRLIGYSVDGFDEVFCTQLDLLEAKAKRGDGGAHAKP